MNHLYERYREEKIFVNCYRNISLNMDLNGIEFVNSPTTPRRHPRQLHMTRMSFVPTIFLPNIQKYQIQQELGFVASASGFNGMHADFNGGILYKASKRIPTTIKYIGNSDCKVSLFNSTKSAEGSIELSTNPVKNLSVVYAMRIGHFGIIPSISMSRVIDPSFSVNASTTPGTNGLQDANFGFVKLFPNHNIRVDFDSRITDSEVNNECLVSKDLNKKFSILGGIVQKGELKPGHWNLKLTACIGWKIILNSHSFCEVRSSFGMGNNEILVRFKRNGIMTSIPITFGTYPSYRAVFYPLIANAVTGGLMYLYQRLRTNSKRLHLVMVKKQKNRLLDDRSTFNIRAGELSEKLATSIAHEIHINGLVILRAFGGERSKVKQIETYYKSKQNAQLFSTVLNTPELLIAAASYDIELPFDYTDSLSEIVDISPFVQNCVKRSYIDATYSQIVNQEGLFNPCIDTTKRTAAYIVYSYKGKVTGVFITRDDHLRIGNIAKTPSSFSPIHFILRQL